MKASKSNHVSTLNQTNDLPTLAGSSQGAGAHFKSPVNRRRALMNIGVCASAPLMALDANATANATCPSTVLSNITWSSYQKSDALNFLGTDFIFKCGTKSGVVGNIGRFYGSANTAYSFSGDRYYYAYDDSDYVHLKQYDSAQCVWNREILFVIKNRKLPALSDTPSASPSGSAQTRAPWVLNDTRGEVKLLGSDINFRGVVGWMDYTTPTSLPGITNQRRRLWVYSPIASNYQVLDYLVLDKAGRAGPDFSDTFNIVNTQINFLKGRTYPVSASYWGGGAVTIIAACFAVRELKVNPYTYTTVIAAAIMGGYTGTYKYNGASVNVFDARAALAAKTQTIVWSSSTIAPLSVTNV